MGRYTMKEPNYKAASETLTIVQALFPGGLRQFAEDGGELCYIPLSDDTDEIYIYHPKPFPETLQKTLEKFGDGVGLKYVFVQTRNFNPETCNPESVSIVLNETAAETLATKQDVSFIVNIYAAIMVVLCFGVNKDSPVAKDLVERITKLSDVVRAIFVFKDGNYRYEAPAVETSKLRATVAPEIPKRDRPIGESDMADLKILLHDINTVEDLLKRM